MSVDNATAPTERAGGLVTERVRAGKLLRVCAFKFRKQNNERTTFRFLLNTVPCLLYTDFPLFFTTLREIVLIFFYKYAIIT